MYFSDLMFAIMGGDITQNDQGPHIVRAGA